MNDRNIASFLPQIETMAAEAFLIDKISARTAMARVVRMYPQALGLEIIFAFLSVQSNLGLIFDTDPAELERMSDDVNQACALLAADLYALQMQGASRLDGEALLALWGEDEAFFSP